MLALLSKNWLPTLGSNEEPPVSETGDLPVDLVGNIIWLLAKDSNPQPPGPKPGVLTS